jgi:hypothetical protein
MGNDKEKSRTWREKNKDAVILWRRKMEELRNLSIAENWHYERMEMEVAQLLDKELREIWDFGTYYTGRIKSGSLRQAFVDALYEIREYGTLEPQWKRQLLGAIQTTKRKMKK